MCIRDRTTLQRQGLADVLDDGDGALGDVGEEISLLDKAAGEGSQQQRELEDLTREDGESHGQEDAGRFEIFTILVGPRDSAKENCDETTEGADDETAE